ncbi:hypothetical protein OIU77_025173 [Salix suchowensis]|uniref:Uncharacterized protein n=1 Tax=Salix suchowensis TaxID=1278906 RepID=A0ABQ9BV91_9ROSI|nr:hypothetical protein OIU78_011902 [Salix suchowensis]KAJ6391122.1 hypothetical protein OIU77_025173 [Salix suchowensis]
MDKQEKQNQNHGESNNIIRTATSSSRPVVSKTMSPSLPNPIAAQQPAAASIPPLSTCDNVNDSPCKPEPNTYFSHFFRLPSLSASASHQNQPAAQLQSLAVTTVAINATDNAMRSRCSSTREPFYLPAATKS